MTMTPRLLLPVVFALLAAFPAAAQQTDDHARFSVVEASISEMVTAMEEGRTTSRQIVEQYLTRIGTYEDLLNAALYVTPRALEEADERDRERALGIVRGPLHGIPIALKDVIHTVDMPTTGGALAFRDLIAPYDATLTKQLRDAGAIVLAKAGLTELANWMAAAMPGSYNAVGGFALNPYDPRRDPRRDVSDGRPALGTGGSTSGVGTAASLWAANVGTETSGSILSPSSQNMLVGIKPTVGRISRWGVIPITADQDTPGPMARSVADAAILLGAMEGEEPDPNDPATGRCEPPPGRDYTQFLQADALRGARIGVPRAYFYEPVTPPGTTQRGGLAAAQKQLMEDAIALLERHGAVVVDPADIPSVLAQNPSKNVLLWPICAGPQNAKGMDAECSVALKYGMKRDFDLWLRTLGDAAPVSSLAELRAWNLAHAEAGAIRYGQAQLDISDEMDLESDRGRYESDRARDLLLSATNGIDAAIGRHELDALLFPGATGAALAARAGYPSVIVPFGFVPNEPTPAFPDGFGAKPSPYGVTFTGLACSEPRLIALAYAFEQVTRRRVPPPATP
jgi:amidase